MILDVLVETLTKHLGARKDGNTFLLAADSELTLFVAVGGDTLTVPRVDRLEVVGTLLVADTPRGERFVFPWEDVRAVKVARADGSGRERGAGFSR